MSYDDSKRRRGDDAGFSDNDRANAARRPIDDHRVTYWIPSYEIDLFALAFYMQKFVDTRANINPGNHWQNKDTPGYYIKSREGLGEDDIIAIKLDSREWKKESRKNEGKSVEECGPTSGADIGTAPYVDSAVAGNRVRRGRAERTPRTTAPTTSRTDARQTPVSDPQYPSSSKDKISGASESRHQVPGSYPASTSPMPIPVSENVPKTQTAGQYGVSQSSIQYNYSSPGQGGQYSSGYGQQEIAASEPTFYNPRQIEEIDVDYPKANEHRPRPNQPSSTGAHGFQAMTATAPAAPARHDSSDFSNRPNRAPAREQPKQHEYNSGRRR